MVCLHCLILILLFSEFRTDLALSSKPSEEISAIIQSYSDGFTTVIPDETQQVTAKTYPIRDRGYVHNFPKLKYDDKPAFSNVSLAAARSSESVEVSRGSEEPKVFITIVPEKAHYDAPQIYNGDTGYVHDFKKAKYDNNPAVSNEPLVVAGTHPEFTSYKDFSSASAEESNESDEPRGPADHVIPYSEHENPREPSTRPNYTAPGFWAKPPPEKNIPLEFSPTKFLAQVRDSHTIKHVPREYAVESAETSEEKENAARLKEVVKESKANTIYTEEGYEDAAYDHAGHIRDADFQEDFDRKLNEELERKAAYTDKKKRPKTYKKHKPRKHRHSNHNDFAEKNKSQSEPVKEEKSSKLQLDLQNVPLLKNALDQPVINPKLAVESGIANLERDLRNEYRETQRTSTEPYVYETTEQPTTFRSPAPTESAFQSKMDLETTTMRRNVYTIRPKKTIVSVTPKPRHNRFKKPLRAFPASLNVGNYNAFTTNAYPYEPTQLPSTADYGKTVWGYLLQNENATVPITYPPTHYEQQTVNPLAVATVNGHGPYLLVGTDPPEALTPSSAESQNLISTVEYGAMNDYNVTQPIIVDPNIHHNPFISVKGKNNRVNYENYPHDTFTSKPMKSVVNKKKTGEIKHRDKYTKPNRIKSQYLTGSSPNYIERDSYMDYYNAVKSSETPNGPITFSNNKPPPYANLFGQWPDIRQPGESNDGSDVIARPPVKLKNQKGTMPMTKLLPPAPLSASEYATFYRQNEEIKPMMSTVIEMMPIIDAIHKHEYEENSFPFLFRRKRSTFGFFRTPNFKPIEKKRPEIDENDDSSQSSSNSSKSKNVTYPTNFHSLLNEASNVASKEVDAEIKKHFRNDAKPSSDESSYKSNEEFTSNKNSESLESTENYKEGNTVEVQVPTVDFSSAFARDRVDSITEKPRINTKKYPFYKDSSAMRNTVLKYIVNPKEVPKKTLGGMEFYDSRIRECEEVNPDLDKIVPEDEELANKRGPQKKKLRLQGLGDKIDCYKAKYFDETPFDNPLFIEKDVEMPPPPIELNPKEFASRILELPAEKDAYTISRGPKNPEFLNIKRGTQIRRPMRHHVSGQNVRHHLHPKWRKPNFVNTSHQRYQYPSKIPIKIEDEMKPPEIETRERPKMKIKTSKRKAVPRYQRLVYEDVMGNIMNLDKSKKSHVPKQGITPLYSKHYKRDNNRQQGITGFKNLKSGTIGGLVPPPRKITNVPTMNLRIYKRSVASSDKEASDKFDEKDKTTFRIVFTTPPPKNTSYEKQSMNPDRVNETQNMFHSVKHSRRHSNRPDFNSGRYGKFSTHKNSNSSYETRRKEPKYNVPENSFASSTLIPVMVKLYDNFTARIPRGSKNNQAKQQVPKELDDTEPTEKSKVPDENVDQAIEKEKEEEDPNKQFVTFKPVYAMVKPKTNGIVTTTYASTLDIDKDHKELAEFLKGNPPGYDKAFAEEIDTEDKKKESYKVNDENLDAKEENEDEISELETEDPEQKKESHAEDRAPDDDSEEVEENSQSDSGEGENDDAQDDKPFVRFSSRPDSPPENYEDERYADLGPRVNKPYFYHPPFDVPAYEKYASVDHSGDEYGHEETEYPEKYVFPWAHDDEDDESKEESEHHSVLDRHEFPWEKRERRERERQKREKMRKKYNEENFDPNHDSYGKASSVNFVYTPSKYKHLRGKKDVNALQSNMENRSSKFSSKYKSANEDDSDAEEEDNDDIEKSILKYIENIETSTTMDEIGYTTPKEKIKIVNENITSQTLNKKTDALASHSNMPESSTSPSSTKRERVGRIISTTASSVSRSRGRTRRIIMNNNNKTNDNETVLSEVTNLGQVQPALSSKTTRQRGRNRATISMTTTTTAKPNIRRRTRLSPTTSTTPRSVNEKRRRSFRITSYTGRNAASTTPPTISTSTGRTVEREHRSRVSKEMIITKTVEDSDSDDLDEDSDKNASNRDNKKSPSKVAQISRSTSRRRQHTKSTPDGENPSKKERVEKVTITMEETPDHVYETKEIDKDGIKGKFITITANNNSVKAIPAKRSRDHTTGVDDAEMEEMQRRMEAFKSFDSVIKDTEDSEDDPGSLRTAEKYVVGSLFKNLPLPLTRKMTDKKEDNINNDDENEDEDEDESEYNDDADDDDEEDEEEDPDSEDLRDKKSDEEPNRNNSTVIATASTEKNSSVIKNPNNRNYYYVETP